MARAEIFFHVFRHQMPAVGGGVHQQIIGRGSDRAVENRLQGLIARLIRAEGKIVAKQDKTLGPAINQIHDIGQIAKIAFFHFDQAQPFACKLTQHRFD